MRRDFPTASSDDRPKRVSLLRGAGRAGDRRVLLNDGHGSSGVTCRHYNTAQASLTEAISQRDARSSSPPQLLSDAASSGCIGHCGPL
ncbi:hypothetical protein MRX96_019006 [Rhipicephalus microplus]